LRAASDRAIELRAQRMQLFRELGRLRLDQLQSDALAEGVSELETQALAVFEKERQALEDVTERRRQAQTAAERAETERDKRAAALEQALHALADLRTSIEAETKVSREWAERRGRIDQFSAMAIEAERKLLQAEADRERKRSPYEADPLFSYLWNRRFGTPAYSSRALVRLVDRWLARLIGYDRARVNYQLLNEIPVRLREHATRLRQDADAAAAELNEIEQSALQQQGVQQLERRVAQARTALKEAELSVSEAHRALSLVDREHEKALLRRAPYGPAVDLLAKADAAQDLDALYRKAMQTPSPEDEGIIRRIQATEASIGSVEEEIGRIRREIRELAERRGEIEVERDEFRRRGYDRPNGMLGNEKVLTKVMGGILGGILSGKVMRDVVDRGYQRQTTWNSDFGGPWGSPPASNDEEPK
jgi:hypothetical protein